MSTRCLAKTAQGTQCTRNAKPGSLFCYQHQESEQTQITRGRSGRSKSPKRSKSRSRSKSPQKCCVCLEESEDKLKCKHTLCVDCAKQLYHPICPLCRGKLEGPQISQEVLQSIQKKSKRSPSPPRGSIMMTGISLSGGEAEDLLRGIGVQPPSNIDGWIAFLKTYRRITNFHRDNFPNVSFENWVRSLDSRTIAELIRQLILR